MLTIPLTFIGYFALYSDMQLVRSRDLNPPSKESTMRSEVLNRITPESQIQ